MGMDGKHDEKPGRRGFVLVLSSPSGAGKTTLARSLMETDHSLSLSVSATTRERRPSEAEGVHYYFKTHREFERMRDGGDLLESAEVHGNFYGTPAQPVMDAVEAGKDILFDIDWQGTQQAKKKLTDDLVGVFILPPSAKELENRLRRRAEDTDTVIRKRLKNAADEIVHFNEYDYVIINRDFQESLATLKGIVSAERAKRWRQAQLPGFVDSLGAELSDGDQEVSA
ncbi:MAG: guanylate kinase [Pseudomonadota bacterium]